MSIQSAIAQLREETRLCEQMIERRLMQQLSAQELKSLLQEITMIEETHRFCRTLIAAPSRAKRSGFEYQLSELAKTLQI
ncbi:hypothetical protein AGMMS50229_02710 [Campylobacterota bacterium]|nr:hypothetical protein AGMMS50229_02710 [Campylobacterota bacterium]